MFAHRRSVALIALNHWLPAWPVKSYETFQNVIKVEGWRWVCLGFVDDCEWKFVSNFSSYITQSDWRPFNVKGNQIEGIEPDKPWPRS